MRQPRATEEIVAQVYEAAQAGKATQRPTHWDVNYAGNCESPLCIRQNDKTRIFIRIATRCRKCPPCLRARTNYWGFAAMQQTIEAQNAGRRTWFGTLTLNPEQQIEYVQRAYERWAMTHTGTEQPSWWSDPKCDERFKLVRDELLPDLQKFWKRLRKQGHHFKYFAVFERHKSGLPHLHFLLHEQGEPITKRAIQTQWMLGHSNISIVGGRSARSAAPEKAAWYVVKYLSKSYQSRQIASRLYRPNGRVHGPSQPRSQTHNDPKGEV